MDICPVRTEDDYKAALASVAVLVDADPEPGTEEGDRLQILSLLIEHYEAEHFPLAAPTPVVRPFVKSNYNGFVVIPERER
ncbi:HTH-type transcriptional regulator / antitoxin HigA [Paraburkholderia sacchari]|uniref:helix-turn-helix domain-containing protein n=1 Tax=Paraburkholderia sacchari TaxID=159450 RepID=UPI0039A53BD1